MKTHLQVVRDLAAALGPDQPVHRYSEYLTRRFGGKTYRIGVDAGFSCPVRDGGTPCAYCDVRGSRAPYLGNATELEKQISGAIAFVSRRYRPRYYLLYFQAFSGTYAPVEELKRIYDTGLACADFMGLIVATRPDCIDERRAALLSEYRAQGLDVWVELGLQSASDSTLRRIRRGHTVDDFDRATRLLHEYEILVTAHLILGLPGETGTEVGESARHLNDLGVEGVKFHNLTLVEGTEMYRQYREGVLRPPDASEYAELLVVALENLSPETVVMRLTCDPPRGKSSVPTEFPNKSEFQTALVGRMKHANTWQGRALDNRFIHTVP